MSGCDRPDSRGRGPSRRRWPFAALGLLLIGCTAPPAARDESLYRAVAIVTGHDERERPRGVAQAFVDALVKVSGDPRLIDDARLATVANDAASMVVGLSYRDRMEGLPLHDEQGTRDRPYDLTVSFDPARIDAALASLGRAPWLAQRPRVAVLLGIRIAATSFVLAGDGERGFDQRNALADAAMRRGLRATLPSSAQLDASGVNFDMLATSEPESLEPIARAAGADRALVGRMIWDQAALAWNSEWRLANDGVPHRWSARDATFDEAFRSALGGAAQILSGNGTPRDRRD